MREHSPNGQAKSRFPLTFFLIVFMVSGVFWVLGPVAERLLPEALPGDIPLSSLMVCSPLIAAVVLVWRAEGSGDVKRLLKRAFDHKRIKRKIWYIPVLLLCPAMMLLQQGLMRLMGVPLPAPQVPILLVPVFFALYFIAALGEEVGWQGYAIGPLQERWNALTASTILGIVWALWHILPLIQMNRAPTWIAWQCMNIVVTRIVTVWIFNSTGKSLFAAILFHAMYNVSTVLLPDYGWHYDPFVAFIIVAVAAAVVTFLWGPRTLARFRYARPGGAVPSRAAH
jgi:membrane protease YdiL (CAAX protease family)